MCMSNLPIEFDENGDPHLAEAADEVDRPGCDCGDDVALDDLDPEDAFADIAESMPGDVLEHLEAGSDAPEPPDAPDASDPPTATGGD